MPPKKLAAGADRLGALPDDVLHLVLSFLPAEETVRTCVLARRWLNLWKSTTGLHIHRNMHGQESAKAAREFVDHLLLLRGGSPSPLDTVELRLVYVDTDNADDMARIRLWIRHILTYRVQVLNLEVDGYEERAQLSGLTLISNHLRKLELSGILFEDTLLDFSCCPALEVLEIDSCNFALANTLSSRSLRCLSIFNCCSFDIENRVRIHTPNLRSLLLEMDSTRRTPMLDRMPFLMEATVVLSDSCDICETKPAASSSGDCEDDDCFGCYGVIGDDDDNVLLQGLSEARSLELMSNLDIFIFRRDMKWCLVFSNLKTLLLDEYWCVPSDFSALTYMLNRSPVLEKLTLELYCTGPKSELIILKGIPHPTAISDAMPQHLKAVEVKCKAVDDKVIGVLKFLSELGICFQF